METLTNHEDGPKQQPLVLVVADQVEVGGNGAAHLGTVIHKGASTTNLLIDIEVLLGTESLAWADGLGAGRYVEGGGIAAAGVKVVGLSQEVAGGVFWEMLFLN